MSQYSRYYDQTALFNRTAKFNSRPLLEKLRKSNDINTVRMRSYAVLLSAEGLSINEVAKVYEVKWDIVSLWLDLWQEKAIKGLRTVVCAKDY